MIMTKSNPMQDLFLEKIREYKITKLCDFGAGCGWFGKNLLETETQLEKIWAVDLYEQNKIIDNEGIHPLQEFIDVNKLNTSLLKEQNCQAVLLLNSLHHLEYPIHSLKQIAQILPVGGHVFILDFEAGWDTYSCRNAFLDSCLGDAFSAMIGKYHRKWYSLEEAKDLLDFGPFQLVSAEALKLSSTVEEKKADAEYRKNVHQKYLKQQSNNENYEIIEIFSKFYDILDEQMKKNDYAIEKCFFIHLIRNHLVF